MQFIKAIDTEGKTQIINLSKIINVSKYPNDNIKLLAGAGLYWEIQPGTIELIDCPNDLFKEINNL